MHCCGCNGSSPVRLFAVQLERIYSLVKVPAEVNYTASKLVLGRIRFCALILDFDEKIFFLMEYFMRK